MLVALFALSASAVQIGSVTIGGENQDRIKNVAATFTVTNNHTTTSLTGITFAFSGGAENSKYALSVTGPSTLAPSTTGTYTINGTIPLDHASVDSADLVEKALKIGVMTVSGTLGAAVDSASSDVSMQAVNQLKIKNARIECDTKSQSLDDGDRVKNMKPGQDCTLEIEVENEFDDSDKNSQKIGDIAFDTIDINLDSSDGDADVDSEDDLDDLDAGDEDAITADIEIDDEADDGTITIDVRVTGRDENGAVHGEALDFRLEIERLSHDIQIRRVELTPALVSNCQATNAKLSVGILNQGKRDEDEISVEVSAPDLQLTKKIDNIELDQDDSTTVTFDVPVAKGAKEGVVRVDVKTYFDTVAPSNSGSVELNINECQEEASETPIKAEEPQKQSTVVVPQASVTPVQGQAQAAPKKQTSFSDSKAYVALLAVLSVLIAVAIVAAVVFMVRKKRD